MKKWHLLLIIIVFNSFNLFSQDLFSGGTNSWLFHTPDDGRTSLHIAPKTNGTWDWTKQTVFYNNGSISISGNVGIGTITPNQKLELAGSIRLNTINSKIEWNGNTLQLGNYANSIPVVQIRGSESYNPRIDIMNAGNTQTMIKFNAGGNSYINGGNVGIGTTNPQSKLAVNGTITATEVVVTTEGWSDFVFNKNYKLRDLEQVENFIEENNHLPDIPSEKEVLENGIQLGEMDAKLLQKIEELTLYMIEQNKMMKAQSKEIQVLKEKINKMETVE